MRRLPRWIGLAAALLWGMPFVRAQDTPKPKPEPSTEPVRAAETVVVTATRTSQPAVETLPSLIVVSTANLTTSAAPALNDTLQQMPGFNLFRRTGSRMANPTSQDVSLRDLDPSDASRALVLKDDLPLNDPFEGWMYWNRVPREAVEHIEVLQGGVSDLYGSSALDDVVQFLTRPPG